MFEQNVTQCSSNDKNLVISFSLLMRIMEWCHEDAKNDVAMHKVMEKLVAFNDGKNPLTIDVYDCLVAEANDGQQSEEESDENDLENAYELGCEKAECGEELSREGGDYSHIAGEIITDEKDNGYGASNAELEQFWNGYDSVEPMKKGCWTEMDISDIVNDKRTQPTTICLGQEDESPCCAGDMLDTDALQEIERIINAGRL